MRVLSAMQPSGQLHLGNYFGSIKPNVELQPPAGSAEESIFMIADLHALTSVRDPAELRRYRQGLTMDLLACGFDPTRSILFFQSAVPEHMQLAWILSCVTPMGFLERAVSYKEKVQQGLEASVGLFIYPVLQAADILLYDTDIVPVGKDQKQHLEMARDIAQKFNHRYDSTPLTTGGEGILVIPEARIREEVAVVPGTDGRKMSKSYGNTIPLFGSEKEIEKAVMGIVTDSKDRAAPKDPETNTIYLLHKLFLNEAQARALAEEYRKRDLSYSEAKKRLFRAYLEYFKPMREKRRTLETADVVAERVIQDGAKRAKKIAEKTMLRVRKAVGLY